MVWCKKNKNNRQQPLRERFMFGFRSGASKNVRLATVPQTPCSAVLIDMTVLCTHTRVLGPWQEGSSKKSGSSSIKSKVQRRSQRGGDSAAGSVLSRGSAAISSVFSTGSASSSIFRGSQGSADDGDEGHAGAQGSRVVRGSRGGAGSSKVQRRSKVLRGGGTQGRTTLEVN